MARRPRTTPADAVAAANDTERRSAEMVAHMVEMTEAVMESGNLYRDIGLAIVAGPSPSPAAVRNAHRAGLDAERAVCRFQRTFHDWLSAMDRASRAGAALRRAPAAGPADASVH